MPQHTEYPSGEVSGGKGKKQAGRPKIRSESLSKPTLLPSQPIAPRSTLATRALVHASNICRFFYGVGDWRKKNIFLVLPFAVLTPENAERNASSCIRHQGPSLHSLLGKRRAEDGAKERGRRRFFFSIFRWGRGCRSVFLAPEGFSVVFVIGEDEGFLVGFDGVVLPHQSDAMTMR